MIDKTHAVLIGGPLDGNEYHLRGEPLPIIRLPELQQVHPVPLCDPQTAYPMGPSAHLHYVLMTDPLGFPSIDDQGRVRYQMRY